MARAFRTRGSHSVIRICLALGQLHFDCSRKELANELPFARICSFPAVTVLGTACCSCFCWGLAQERGKCRAPLSRSSAPKGTSAPGCLLPVILFVVWLLLMCWHCSLFFWAKIASWVCLSIGISTPPVTRTACPYGNCRKTAPG